MKEGILHLCGRKNTCFECKSECVMAGVAMADCMRNTCDQFPPKEETCLECRYNANKKEET